MSKYVKKKKTCKIDYYTEFLFAKIIPTLFTFIIIYIGIKTYNIEKMMNPASFYLIKDQKKDLDANGEIVEIKNVGGVVRYSNFKKIIELDYALGEMHNKLYINFYDRNK